MNVTFNKRDPIYLQVIQYFKRQIVSGEFDPGDEMPSRRQLANQLKINPNTVQRAYSEMEEQRLIYTEPNRPSRVTADASVLNQLKREWLDQAVNTFVSAIDPIDIPLDDIVHLIEKKMHTRKKDTQ
ncbi:DNA-binding transcriptional regulator YhcF, GntR family [Alkalibacterium putridalgicola]|uniref:DNA-binding transcriptional regulator YhcF, GntR family n=1 Tax=Alkalibacterium putridalgicola TaxID=426703 RepID=A0A1H7VZX2_9LACT|nr:GntR family transcriptional regulator [Alkalibacterium putridalgicola]GEK88686.1 GntR family transcriptional regulator [Alkalibacterium putridalgicola]SEM14614.1 DNA-binding transcriptional regulator YhcF, GntR family [Alkalibacterium putridalgicola]